MDKGRLEGRLTEARAGLRRVLARRQLTPSKDDDARIEACTDLATKWSVGLTEPSPRSAFSDALG